METPIYRAAYRWTSEELETAMRRQIKSGASKGYRSFVARACVDKRVAWRSSIAGLLASALAIAWLPSLFQAESWVAVQICLAVIWATVSWLADLGRNTASFSRLRHDFRQTPGADQMTEYEISSTEVKRYARGFFYSARAWKSFVKVVEVEDGFLFYAHPRFFFWLPFRAFEMPEAPERVREIIQASGVAYQKIAA